VHVAMLQMGQAILAWLALHATQPCSFKLRDGRFKATCKAQGFEKLTLALCFLSVGCPFTVGRDR